MSTKGVSNTASRRMVEELGAGYDIPLLVLRDFDKAGFTIVGTFRRDTRRYTFTRPFAVIDLGLRLEDVTAWELQAEDVQYGASDPTRNLRDNGATTAEVKFLCKGQDWHGYHGQRVELNAFTSPDLIAWVEGKLHEHGVRKVIPGTAVLAAAYRGAVAKRLAQQRVQALLAAARDEAEQVRVPARLARKIRRLLQERPEASWTTAVAALVMRESARTQENPAAQQHPSGSPSNPELPHG
jgi:hypothetical protein